MTEVSMTRRGRVTPEREAELYEVVLDLLGEVGYDGLTMDAVAARTRSSKATLYRQWGGKVELVVAAMKQTRPVDIEQVDTGSLRGDFDALLANVDDAAMARTSSLMRGLAMAMHHHRDLGRVFREQIVEPDLRQFRRVLERAVERGEIRADNPALDHAVHLLLGAFVARGLLDGQPPTGGFLREYVRAVLLPVLVDA
ncbi:TetR/AcrR family transcriptional regulator [Streptomyces sp. NPDC005648]|uniref:TetR/AcrR family transcriptional regulator n=1 Tax=Streptomyces sp. NPDC005648 TaxID=3157044 RepID=UPI0033A11C22